MEVLGEGGFGVVIKAFHIHQAKYFALKYVKYEDSQDLSDIFIEDFILERVQLINNSDFLQYYGIFKDPKKSNGYVLMMESGLMNLSDLLKMGRLFEECEVIYILNTLVNQLITLQDHGICNRDIKPANVIIVEDPKNKENFYYKISDFGIGCFLDNPSKTLIPASELCSCTKKYAAPEVIYMTENDISDNETYDPFKADIYSLAILTLDLLGYHLKDYINKDLLLKKLIQGMLINNPKNRLSLKEIKDDLTLLKKYQKNPSDISNYAIKWPEFKDSKKSAKEKIENFYNNFKAYKEISRYETAGFYILECKSIIDSEKNLDEKNLADIYGDLAWYYYMVEGNFAQAEPLFLKSLELKTQLYGEESLEMAMMYNIIGLIFDTELNDDQKTEEYYNKSIKTFLKVCQGENHEELARPYHNIALFYEKKLENERAEFYHMKSLEVRLRLSGIDHKETAWNFNSLAHFYQGMKDYVKAEEYYYKSLNSRIKLLGEEHEDCVMSYDSLAFFYWKVKKDFLKAEEFFNKSLKANIKIYGQKHKVTMTSLKNLEDIKKLNTKKF